MKITKKLPVGIENFEEIRTEGFYYIDKTGLIKDLLHSWGKVNLFTRPRRFGKSLTMSMLRSFFEIDCSKDSKGLFDGLEISRESELCNEYMGKFPVISISLKGVSGESFSTARSMMCSVIGSEAMRFQFLLESERLSHKDKELYNQLTDVDNHYSMSDAVLINSLLTLTTLLKKHYDQKVIILIDEYDVPLDKAFQFGYYDSMVNLIRSLFMQALKSNDSLYFSVLTGCLRVSKESIFTGLNNPKVHSITSVRFDEYFGFTDHEVRQLLTDYGLTEHFSAIKEWYDGYRFGEVDVYCPWDVICYCDELLDDPHAEPQEYWSHTSSNNIVRRFINKATKQTQNEIERLIAGETLSKEIHQELTYTDLDTTIANLWSVLFTTGYLTQRGKIQGNRYQLAIPNREIRQIFITQVKEWFSDIVRKDTPKLDAFCTAFFKGDASLIEEQFNSYLMKTISIRDTNVPKAKKENFYHGILLGLLSHMEDWLISSNAESGEGYSDILVEIEAEKIGIVIEVKYAEHHSLDAACKEALQQIEANNYAETLLADGMTTILKYGIACYKKHCKVICVS